MQCIGKGPSRCDRHTGGQHGLGIDHLGRLESAQDAVAAWHSSFEPRHCGGGVIESAGGKRLVCSMID